MANTNRMEITFPDNPFPGLRPFRTDESHLFFGRRKQADEIVRNLLDNRFCAVTGASGSGKSSLIYCGVIPTLFDQFTENPLNWEILTSRPGNSPVSNLLNKLGQLSDIGTEELIKKPEDFGTLLGNIYVEKKTRILIIIDQFEEVFRYTETEQRKSIDSPFFFTDVLTDLIKHNNIPVYLIVTMRSDFIGECSRFTEFTSLINSSNYLVPRMTRDDFIEVIEGPVISTGASINSSLVEKLLEDLGDNPDQLPVLQHALMRTWNYWKLHNDINRPISVSDYDSVGRIEKALSEHANEAYDELNAREKEVCEKIFRTITEKGSDNKGVRKPASLNKLSEICQASQSEVIKVLDTFRSPGRSFITPSNETELTGETVIDISHESLMRIWDRLRTWVDEESSAVQMYKRLAESANQYQIGRSGLWRPPDLQLAINWRRKTNPTLAWAERINPAFELSMVFLETSEKEFQKEEENKIYLQKRQLKRTRFFALVLGTAAVIALGLFIWTRELQVQAEKEFQRAETQRQLAELKTLEAQQESDRAEKAAIEAQEQREIAEKQSTIADIQRNEAERNALEATKQATIATINLEEANRQRSIAQTNEEEANKQKMEAEKAREEAFQRRMLTIAKTLAVKSQQASTDADLRSLLAYQGFIFNERYKGYSNDVDIFSGLYKALKISLGNSYNVFHGHDSEVKSVVFIPGSQSFLSAGNDGNILKWNLHDKEKSYSTLYKGNSLIETIRISQDGRLLVCADNKSGLLLFDLTSQTGNPKILAGTEKNIRAIAIAPDNNTMFTAGMEPVIDYWDISTGKTRAFTDPGSRVNALSLSPDGLLLAGGTRDGRLMVWRTKSETITTVITEDPVNPIHSLAFSPDYKYIVAGNIKGQILIFRADNFEQVRMLSNHKARITDLNFTPDGKKMISTSFDGNVLLWNMEDLTGPPVVLDDHSGFVFSAAVNHNGNYMVSGSSEGDKLIARPTQSAILAGQICSLVKRNMTEEEWRTYVGEDIPYEQTCKKNENMKIEIR